MRTDIRQPRRFAASVLAPAAALFLLASCARQRPMAEQRARAARSGHGDLIVAAAWPWSAGAEATLGNGLDLALGEIDSAGGVLGRRLRVERIDDHGAIDDAELAAQRIALRPDVVAVIGHLQSYVSVPAAAVYDDAGLVMLAPATTDPELTTHGYRHVFRETFTDRAVGEEMARFAAGRAYHRVAIYYVRDSYGRGLANAFEDEATRLGISVAARAAYDQGNDGSGQTFRSLVALVEPLEVDAIFVAGEVPSAGALIAALRRGGITVPILGGDAMSSDALIKSAGHAADGTVVASMFSPDEPRAEVQRFVHAYEARYGAPPDAAAALGYDAVRLLATAITRAGSPAPDDVARALHTLRAWKGVTGAFTFDERGDPVAKPVVKLVVAHGRFQYLHGAEVIREAAR